MSIHEISSSETHAQQYIPIGKHKSWWQFRSHRKVEKTGVKVARADRIGHDQTNVMDASGGNRR